MSAFKQIVKTEFIRYFYSPLAFVYLICFLLLNGLFAFYFGHFFERERADLLSMFAFQPWLYILFVSGIAMRSWAEEFRSKTILQIATLPIPLSYFVWGKFFATWLFCLFAPVLTSPFWITVNILGSPDNSVITAGYFASLMLSGCMLAIAQTMSALTKNQIVALVLSVLVNLLFFMSGFDLVLDIFRGVLAPSLVDMIASFSFLTHFSTMSAGLLELRDIVFFGSLIILFNLTTLLIVSYRTAGTTRWLKTSKRNYYIVAFVGLLLGFCGINLIANIYLRQIKIDFTEEKMFSLTSSTRKIIRDLKGPIVARLYYSPVLGERNPDARLYFDRIRLLLQQYAALSRGKIEIKIYNPKPFSEAEDRALAAGIQPLPIISNNSNAYFGLTLDDEKGNQKVIPFFPLSRQNFAEQDLSEVFYMLGRKKPKLGLLTSLPMGEKVIENVATSKWEILNQIEKFYDIYSVSSNLDNLDALDVLMIVHPQGLTLEAQEEIRNYSLRGGKVLAFFDVATEAQHIYAPVTSMLTPSDYGILPKAWGIRFIDNGVVADLGNSSFVDATKNYASNPEFTQDAIQFYVRNDGFAKHSDITANLKKMMITSASVFVPEKNAKIKFQPLLMAGENSQLMSAKVVYDRIPPAVLLRNFKADNKPKVLSARIMGADSKLDVIVVGDSDLLYDSYWATYQQVLEKTYNIPLLDNANFVLNALDVLSGNNGLLNLRGKSYYDRPFEKIEKQRIELAKNTKIKEKEILDNLARAKIGMTEITAKKNFEGRGNFTPDELAVIANIRKQIDKERQNLFKIRDEVMIDFKNLKNILQFGNVYFVPLVLLCVMLLSILKKNIRMITVKEQFNYRVLWFVIGGLILLGLGLFSVWWQNRENVLDYENKQV
ncbi:MAG: Gldg family protein, partial [Alphaproteobacteria bacterium]|nr:Gldg family protein [Alphaproteobacteria bacterium]